MNISLVLQMAADTVPYAGIRSFRGRVVLYEIGKLPRRQRKGIFDA
jgi:hypothetical protein